MKFIVFIVAASALIFNGCAVQPVSSSNSAIPLNCEQWLKAISEQNLNDWQLNADIPWLRVNRFWASFAEAELTISQRQFWLDQVQQESLQLWGVALQQQNLATPEHLQTIQTCHQQWRDQANQKSVQLTVADNYSRWQRILGLYPVTQLAFRWGAADWRTATRAQLQLGLQNSLLGESGKPWQRYAMPSKLGYIDPQQMLLNASNNPLQVPLLSPQQEQALLEHYAPQFNVQQGGDFDRIGKLESASVDALQPAIYTAITHTRFYGQNLLQLNYVIWFSERPATRWMDIYAGKFDSVIWRVTLTPTGEVLLFDSIHSCGCYHLLFPNPKLVSKPPDYISEPPVIHRLVNFPTAAADVWLQSGTHYLLSVTPNGWLEQAAPAVLVQQSYQQLYPLFARDGLLPDSERAERWLLWPTGVVSPGQMRVMGTQATAFTGERHFDDAQIFERLFEPLSQSLIPGSD